MWLMFVVGLIGLAGLFALASALRRPAASPAAHRNALVRVLLALGFWVVLSAANYIYVLSLLFGTDPGLPPDWVMAMAGCAVVSLIGYGLWRWTRGIRQADSF